MHIIKKHSALLALAAAIAVILVLAVRTYALKDNVEFELHDWFGSREAIQDVAIKGELFDGYHRTLFRLEEGRVDTRTEIFAQPQWNNSFSYVPGGPKRMGGGMEYSVENTTTSYTITSRKQKSYYSIPIGSSEVTPPIVFRSPEGRDGIILANSPEYGLAKIGEKVYFTVPVSAYFTGSSGIYELKFYEWGFGSAVDQAEYAPRKIVDINLDANRPEEHAGVEVLGLEAVSDRLALISVEHNTLFIRSYDSQSGQLLGEASVPDVHLPARGEEGQRTPVSMGYYEGYEAYRDDEQNILTLSFRRTSSETERLHTTILSLDFSDGVKIASTVNAVFDDGEEDTFSGISHMSYRNGKLYVIKTFRDRETEPSRLFYELVRPKHMYIYAYEHSELIYKGELVTELNEDNIRALNLPPAHGGFGYDQLDYRRFADIAVE
ncbi:hypothetical protein [Paenibacillus eucommiae]|uniref:Uncharacterized protein n=1 Tax=Paenibacillus eucommiae TaxID=1355755 RepID=A0ABS4J7E6_9BACL|nr:hypothetical protein [Paenibacillus eucommiae]MBP1995747.1 hypothetical protein [Paenibacillus eucommiae]